MKHIFTLAVILIVAVSAIAYVSQDVQTTESVESSNLTTNIEAAAPESPIIPVASAAAIYADYSVANVDQALAEGQDTFLFFHAAWCPSCVLLDREINNRFSEIPEDLTILKVDFDKEDDLKIKYGITSQNTLVHLNEGGEALNKWSGGGLDEILAEAML
jgi:thiol:disulfide interchange protein